MPWLMATVEDDITLIQELIDWSDQNAAQIAAKIGAANTTINRFANGTSKFRIGRETMTKLREAFPDFPSFIGYDEAPIDNGRRAPAKVKSIDIRYSMGPGAIIEDYPEVREMDFDAGLLRRITPAPMERLLIAHADGDSMAPTLKGGDMVLIDTTQKTLGALGAIWAISLFGAAGIKRLQPIGETKVRVISDNPLEPAQEVDAEDLRIDGRVVWFGRMV
jgi:hypothetical protein